MRNKQVTGVLYGWVFIFILMLITSMILALVLHLTNFNEATLSWLTFPLGLFLLFIGGFIAGIKSQQKGWMTGIIVGLGFTILIFLVQYLGYKHSFSLQQILHHLGFVFSCVIGSIFGVNILGNNNE